VPTNSDKPVPKQARSKETYEKILAASQELLTESGIEGFNSNAIVERAGMTPPAFYRWFPNKYAILEELASRFMHAQNVVTQQHLKAFDMGNTTIAETIRRSLDESVEVSASFVGSHAIMVCMRAIPSLSEIRLKSHEAITNALATRMVEVGLAPSKEAVETRCRLVVELGYAAIELVFETGLENRKEIVERTTAACTAALGL
tara:strand:+ start:341 stop:949 length:609 start_codon:yes stop_codon:yes gene_type:complete